MRLEKIEGKSKKTGKPYVGYCVTIGEYRTPIFFPSKVELIYIEQQLSKSARKEFADFVDDGLGDYVDTD